MRDAEDRTPVYISEPTTLHFSADWRKSRNAGQIDVQTLLQIAETASWWPLTLKYHVRQHAAEQQVIFEAILAGGVARCAGLRAAIDLVVDRLAWDHVRRVRPMLRAREEEVAALRADRERLVADRKRLIAAHEAERGRLVSAIQAAQDSLAADDRILQTMLSSRSWRLTAPMRAARRLLGR